MYGNVHLICQINNFVLGVLTYGFLSNQLLPRQMLRSKNDLLLNFEQNKLSPWPSMCADFSISMHIILKVEEGEMANIVHIKVCRYSNERS